MNVVFFVYQGAVALDITGPAEVFDNVAKLSKNEGYNIHYVSAAGGYITLSANICIKTTAITNMKFERIDMLLVPGTDNISALHSVLSDKKLALLLRASFSKSTRICSICIGSFILAEMGLLNNLTAACHWQAAPMLAQRYPKINVDSHSIYVKQGQIWSSAGGSSGIDMALAIVKEDFGEKVAMDIAKQLVVYAHRPGGQQQFSALLSKQLGAINKLTAVVDWMVENLKDIHSIEQVAEHWHMSLRNFHRLFVKEVKETPAQFLEKLRIEKAMVLLQNKQNRLKVIALYCGFKSEQRLINVFKRYYGISPTEYRHHHFINEY
ncbi:GlxA family transcriptional regulator [Thalassotalea ganghwensis]